MTNENSSTDNTKRRAERIHAQESAQRAVPCLFRMEPIGANGALEAVDIPFRFCSPACREQFLENESKTISGHTTRILQEGDDPDAIEGTVCDQCDRALILDFHFNLPECCVATIKAEKEVREGGPIECPTCQRGVVYHVTTGWTRFWKPCDRCLNPTSFERHNQAEPSGFVRLVKQNIPTLKFQQRTRRAL